MRIGRPRGLLYGVGVNDVDYYTQWTENGVRKTCPIYATWMAMIQRGFSQKFKESNPTYADVFVCEEWKRFSIFSEWMQSQKWEDGGMKLQLEKDILISGNKEYSPSKCVFVPAFVNTVISLGGGKLNTDLPLGVSYQAPSKTMINERTKPYYAYVRSETKKVNLGYYHNPQEAHAAWQEAKAFEIEKVATRYSQLEYSDERVIAALKGRADKLLSDKANGLQTLNY